MDEPSSPILDWREILGAVNMFEYYIIGCGRGPDDRRGSKNYMFQFRKLCNPFNFNIYGEFQF